MEMILDVLQNFYDKFPFSVVTVGLFFVVCALSFFVAFREFWAWYSKVSILKSEMHEVRESLLRIEKTLDRIREPAILKASTPDEAVSTLPPLKPKAEEKPQHFPVMH